VIKAWIGRGFDVWARRLLPFFFESPLSPNTLTMVGAAIALGGAWALANGCFGWAALLIWVGGLFDLLDGAVARAKGLATNFGAFLDSTVDRLVDMALFLGLILYASKRGQLGEVVLAGWAMMGSVLVSYTKARAEAFVSSFEGGLLERGERIVILGGGVLLQAIFPGHNVLVVMLWILALGSSLTVGQRVLLAHRHLAVGKEPAQGTGAQEGK